MEPYRALDKFRLRQIGQQLVAELQTAKEQLRSASTEEEKRLRLESHVAALKRFSEFAAQGIVPKDLLPP
jgi:hypothetical protein